MAKQQARTKRNNIMLKPLVGQTFSYVNGSGDHPKYSHHMGMVMWLVGNLLSLVESALLAQLAYRLQLIVIKCIPFGLQHVAHSCCMQPKQRAREARQINRRDQFRDSPMLLLLISIFDTFVTTIYPVRPPLGIRIPSIQYSPSHCRWLSISGGVK